jgi:hypothetical protein
MSTPSLILKDRIAQRAFRIRKKVYHLELETNAIEAADKIQDMVDSNKRLTKMMEKLQKENAAVSPRTKLGRRWSDDVRRGGADDRDLVHYLHLRSAQGDSGKGEPIERDYRFTGTGQRAGQGGQT